MEIQRKLKRFPVPDFVWEEYKLDQEINDRGIAIDMELAQNAISFDEACKIQLLAQLKERTGLENPNSIQQMIQWLEEKGLQTNSLDKKAVDALLKDESTEVAEVLEMRKQLAKSSVSKYYAMKEVVCSDNRARGMFQFYGASRSGRWAGRMIQLQNLLQNHLECLDAARSILKSGDYEQMQMHYENIPDTLSQLIRTAFVPRSGYKFVVADFSSIEARVLSFLAGEQWRLDVFESGRDIYCMSASQMFHVPVEKHGVNGHLRQKGKIAELVCIAEEQLVLTNHGLLPIEKVSLSDKVWDGENWVSHGGVVYRGERKVLTYEGLTATPDHFVWIEGKSQPIQFGLAAASGAHLVQTGDCGTQKNYQRMAKLYDIRNAGPNHRFTVSGKLVHNCGYGGSVGALKAMGALDMGLREEELQPLVTAWRNSNPNIVRFWWNVDRAVTETVKKHASTETHAIQFSYKSGMLFITLPSGRNLVYVRPRIGQNRFGGECVTYEGIGTNKKWVRIDSYGPKFVENCIAEGVQVVTNRGLVPIEKIAENDLIWDGIEWVSHEGLIYQGFKETVAVGNIHLTPDHKILTVKGWMRCGEAERLDWKAVPLPNSFKTCREYKTELANRISVCSTGLKEHVYDIRNCGPRHRFAVYDRGRLRIVSNCVQGISRDILCYAMQTLSSSFICAHVHDELIIECRKDVSVDAICEEMGRTPPWIQGLNLRADGFESMWYKKE